MDYMQPPAIIERIGSGSYRGPKLEGLVLAQNKGKVGDLENISKSAFKEEVLAGLKKPLQIINFAYDLGYGMKNCELRVEPATEKLVAGFFYREGKGGEQVLDKIVYLREGKNALIVSYKTLKSGFEWKNPDNVAHVALDNGGFEGLLRGLYKLRKWLEERRKDEGTIMIGRAMR